MDLYTDTYTAASAVAVLLFNGVKDDESVLHVDVNIRDCVWISRNWWRSYLGWTLTSRGVDELLHTYVRTYEHATH